MNDEAPTNYNGETPTEIDHRMSAADPYLAEGNWAAEAPPTVADPLLPHEGAWESSPSIVELVVDQDKLREVWVRLETAQSEVGSGINQIELAKYLLDLIQKARNELMAGKDHYEEAERYLGEVEHRIALQKRVVMWSGTVGRNLVLYEMLALVILGGLMYLLDRYQLGLSKDIYYFFNSLVWGGLGGVVGALYALWKHIADDQDFDRQYAVWYLTNPVLGIALGGFVFLIIRAGFFSMTAGGEAIASAWVIYVLAWICGFKQNVVYEIVRRILDVFKVNVT